MTLAATVSRVTARFGAAYTLRAETQTTPGDPWRPGVKSAAYHQCFGRERYAKPGELQGTLTEFGSLLTIDAATVFVRPRVGMKVALGEHAADGGAEWRQVVAVYEPRESGSVRVYKLALAR